MIVANRCQIPTSTASITANFTSRRHHYASGQGDITNIKCVDVGYWLNGTALVSGSSRTVKRYIEYPSGTFHQVKWDSGVNTSKTITGTNIYTSDVVISSITSLPLIIPAGAKFYERTVNLTSTVASFPVVVLPAASNTLGAEDGNSASDLGNSGTISATSTTNTFGCTLFIGNIDHPNPKSFFVYGDSITFGQGDVTNIGTKGGSGYVARTLDYDGTYPYFKLCIGGWQASDAATSPTTTYASNLMAAIDFTDFLSELGINDLRVGRTTTQLKADLQTIYALPTSAGVASLVRKWQTTLTTRTDSTDGYATTTNQTVKTDGNMGSLTSMNTDIRAFLPNVTNVLDAADASMTARDSNIWAGPFPPVLDGTHPTSAKAQDMATQLTFTSGLSIITTGINNTNTFGSTVVVTSPIIECSSLVNTSAFGDATLISKYIVPTGISNTSEFGTANTYTIVQILSTSGINSTTNFGIPHLTGGISMSRLFTTSPVLSSISYNISELTESV